ncbi:MAG: metallophosphoesterase [Candidatus Omnitrophica bacterium]|nr:metallophosphoesterase [Candidatus Omnitrophota bacterium]
MRTFVIGDIHGQRQALVECLRMCQFDYEHDRLISLGDVCDRGPDAKGAIDELLKIRHLVYLLGNHDAWTLDWARDGNASWEWLDQGGKATIESYENAPMPFDHIFFFGKALFYFEEDRRLFVHAGFDTKLGIAQTPQEMFIWDRCLAMEAIRLHEISPEFRFGGYDEIFIGHTPTTIFHESHPRQYCNVWMMDTGAGYGRMLTVMNVDTKEFWQSVCR